MANMDPNIEKYQLKWHSFTSYLHSCVSSSLQSESYTDVALVTTDGHQIMAHRFVLAYSSQYLQDVLKFQPKVTTALPIMIILPPEITYRTLKILIKYMYSGEATVSKDILESVLRGGDLLKIKGLYRPKEDDPLKAVKTTARSESVCSSPGLSSTGVNSPSQPSPGPPPLVNISNNIVTKPSTSGKASSSANSQKVLNYAFNVNKPQDKDGEKTTKPATQPKPNSSEKEEDRQSDEEPKEETLQFVVIKDEPIEWSEVSPAEMELIDDKEVFTDINVKHELYSEDSEDNVHTEQLYTPLTCELCTETFSIPAEWVRHVQTHTDMLPAKRQRRDRPDGEPDDGGTFPPLHCDLCQKYFPTPAEWVQHIQGTHTEFELRLSNNEKTNKKPIKEVVSSKPSTSSSSMKVCTDCYRVFPSQASMLIHKRTHTGEKPYLCEYCFKGFNVKSNLLRHLRTIHDKFVHPTDLDKKDEEPADD
ncbi:histone-lysine N-methyltransferase PRDM9 isoform X2 [Aethina tumida]|uniref:histone-lysine N-methyltransferase PRDM9 isoform X2 n=1 Tax=Aethina tumida TaxID=116153 RepID=UPI002147C259|nr:histone-lysine N-methyltransferase PRDM9 isoform X2 [Aethina tumida]